MIFLFFLNSSFLKFNSKILMKNLVGNYKWCKEINLSWLQWHLVDFWTDYPYLYPMGIESHLSLNWFSRTGNQQSWTSSVALTLICCCVTFCKLLDFSLLLVPFSYLRVLWKTSCWRDFILLCNLLLPTRTAAPVSLHTTEIQISNNNAWLHAMLTNWEANFSQDAFPASVCLYLFEESKAYPCGTITHLRPADIPVPVECQLWKLQKYSERRMHLSF